MDRANARKTLLNREVVVTFLILVGIWVTAIFVDPLKPFAELVFAGFWEYRHYFKVGEFLVQMLIGYLWLFVYAYLLALVIASLYRRYL